MRARPFLAKTVHFCALQESIRTVLAIADANPDMPILLQWTGGRAGGHHGFEDFHDPILKTYAAIRKRNNIVLVGGSGRIWRIEF